MNNKKKLSIGATVVLLLATVGIVWAGFVPSSTYNRPKPLMDYAPQEMGIYDGLYTALDEADCRICHGASTADRHHYSETALEDGLCTPCHEIIPEPPGVLVTRDCRSSGCHANFDNGWHHLTDLSYADQCIACHDPGLINRVGVDEELDSNGDGVLDFVEYPATVVTPTPFSCENCHWHQPVDTTGNGNAWINGDTGLPTGFTVGNFSNADHPSTLYHTGPYDDYNWNNGGVVNYYEYDKPIESNYDTHHMLWNGNVSTDCARCHSVDPDDPSWDPNNDMLIRYCEECHGVSSLHMIEPHVGQGGTGETPAVTGWEAAGFHVPDLSNTNTADVAPTVYRVQGNPFTANEQCYGCHADQLPEWLPEVPAANPAITNISPQLGACDGWITLTGQAFGTTQLSDSAVYIQGGGMPSPDTLPVISWQNNQIEVQVPCWTYAVGNYNILVAVGDSPATVKLSNVVNFTLNSGATVDSISPTSGVCREIITINGTDFGGTQDIIQPTGFGRYTVVQFVASSGTYTATDYIGWSSTSFKTRIGPTFEDLDGDFLRDDSSTPDPVEPKMQQCEDFALGTYNVFVKTIYYEDSDGSATDGIDNDGDGFIDSLDVDGGEFYTDGDTIQQVTTSDPEPFTIADNPAIYLVTPAQSEISHYCGSNLVTEIIKIYGWGFGASKGDSKVYVGIGSMWANTKAALDASNPVPAYPNGGLELNRTVWSDLLVKAAVDLPEGAEGFQLYVWIVKDGQVTDATYGWPGLYILDVDPNTCP